MLLKRALTTSFTITTSSPLISYDDDSERKPNKLPTETIKHDLKDTLPPSTDESVHYMNALKALRVCRRPRDFLVREDEGRLQSYDRILSRRDFGLGNRPPHGGMKSNMRKVGDNFCAAKNEKQPTRLRLHLPMY